jgi:hypothetical protein
MLAIPVPMTSCRLAHSSSPALVSASRPKTSQVHSERQPSSSSSAIVSRSWSVGWLSSCLVHSPTRPSCLTSGVRVVVYPSRSMAGPPLTPH